jgi:hypothetical protein
MKVTRSSVLSTDRSTTASPDGRKTRHEITVPSLAIVTVTFVMALSLSVSSGTIQS